MNRRLSAASIVAAALLAACATDSPVAPTEKVALHQTSQNLSGSVASPTITSPTLFRPYRLPLGASSTGLLGNNEAGVSSALPSDLAGHPVLGWTLDHAAKICSDLLLAEKDLR